MTKENAVFLFISECSLSYVKIAQTSEMRKKKSPSLAPPRGGRIAKPMLTLWKAL